MGWSEWKYIESTKNSDGSHYVLCYRTYPYSSAGKAKIQYYVKVNETGSTYTERWNCVVRLTVDGSTVYTGYSNLLNEVVTTNTSAKSHSTVKDSNGNVVTGYYKGYICIPHQSWSLTNKYYESTKSISGGKASWTFSLAGGFRNITNANCVITADAASISAKGYTEVGKGTTTITDNYDNTFTITATKGSNGTNNTAGGPSSLKWGYTSSYGKTYTSGAIKDLTIDGTGKTRTVYATSTTTATYGSDKEAPTSKAIRQFVGPKAVSSSSMKLTYPSTRSRLTLKEDYYTLQWTAPDINNECPIKGYRVRLQRKRGTGSWTNLHIYSSSGSYLSINDKSTDGAGIYYDTDSTTASLKIYPKYYNASAELKESGMDIKPGDKIRFAINAYTRFGKDNDGSQLFNTGTSETYSGEYEIKNAGIVQVKNTSGSFVEGQVNVYNGSKWVEAEVVQVRTTSGWSESN